MGEVGMSGGDAVRIRELAGIAEFRRAVAFQESIWGEGFSERVPASLMKVTRRLGGVVAGAFGPEEELVGFVYGMTGLEEGGPVHWSDILAVRPGLRDRGVGRRLKHFQRERVLGLGVDLMRWTFDPLESRNAYLNLGHLGAVVREYAVDMYGESDSPLHRGLGTDRYVVSWELTSNRVRDRVAGVRPPPAGAFSHLALAFAVTEGEPDPVPEGVPALDQVTTLLERGAGAGGLRLPIPADIQSLRDRDPDLARRWRVATRRILETALARGWEVRELLPPPPAPPPDGPFFAPVSQYVLVPADTAMAEPPQS